MNFQKVELSDSVRILASGFIHVRVLTGFIEYLYGVLPTTPLTDKRVADRIGDIVNNEVVRGEIGPHQTLRAVELLFEYLSQENDFLSNPFLQSTETGRAYVLSQIRHGIMHFKNVSAGSASGPDVLDL
jgi:hypothetical protein